MFSRFLKAAGLALTVACWAWANDCERSRAWDLTLIWAAPLLNFPIAFLARKSLDRRPDAARADRVTTVAHYAAMIALGMAIFPAVRIVRHSPGWAIPVPRSIALALVWITGAAMSLSVVNLAVRGLGLPFAAKLSSRLASDWMYSRTRNPMVLATLAWLFSLGLLFQSVWFLVWVALILSPGWILFVRVYEQRELEVRFGASYLAYKARTPFLLPRLG
jgi:protein-S-isoprenylcysteine O-methyltransferase Ste14